MKSSNSPLTLIACLTALSPALQAQAQVGASRVDCPGGDGRTPIQSVPGNSNWRHVITEPGSYYLADNIVGGPNLAAIRIDVSDVTIENLRALDEMGIGLALDDFGTGYSSLSYLNSFPIDRVKIDRSFVMEIETESDDAPIAAAIIAMAKSLNLKLVGEGVETEIQAKFLRDRGCDELQGYLFSRPLAAQDFVRFLEKEKE